MAFNYIVSAQKPTAVTEATVGCFTGPDELNLVVGKTNRLEIMLVTAEGLKPVQEVPLYGRIACMRFFRPKNEKTDALLILTAKYHLAVLSWNAQKGEIVNRAHGNMADRIGRPSETGFIAVVDERAGLIGLRLYDGLFKIVHWEEGTSELRAFNLRFDDLIIVDIQFLFNCEKPTIAYIYQDQNGRHLKTAIVNVDEKELLPGPWKQDNIESEASLLIPIPAPFGGCLVIGQETISYQKDENLYTAVAPPLIQQSTITCHGKIDKNGYRYLLGDMAGRLFMLLLDTEEGMDETAHVKDLKVELLGETAIAECLVYLDNGVVFVGSRLGDSQLIRLLQEPYESDPNNFIQILDTYPNLGPIVDMAIVNLEGQSQVVTCSGAFKEGSLRIVRTGIGIEEQASVDLSGVKGLFAFRKVPTFSAKETKQANEITDGQEMTNDNEGGCLTKTANNVDCSLDDILLVSFVGETRILQLNGEELEETELAGFTSDEQTLWAGTLNNNNNNNNKKKIGNDGDNSAICRQIQVTASGVRLILNGQPRVWAPENDKKISLVSANCQTGQLAIACGKQLYYLRATEGIECVAKIDLDYEIACLDISPIDATEESQVCAVGLWTDISVRLYSLKDLNEIGREMLGGEILPRSILMAQFESALYLLVALGDGTLFYYQMDRKTGSLLERKKVTLGSQPLSLRKFRSGTTENVFACSDRPTVIYSTNQKLLFSNVNLKLVTQMCPLNSLAYRQSLVMSDGQTLVIGTVDEIQKLHIRTVPLGETPRRIAHQKETQTMAVISSRYETITGDGTRVSRPSASKLAPFVSESSLHSAKSAAPASESDEMEVHSVLLLDQNTFEVVHAHQLGPNEQALSIVSCQLGDDPNFYYVVGTALVYADESEAKQGRLIVFHALTGQESGKLTLMHEKEIKGAPYSLDVMSGKLVAAINSSVRLFEWTPERELRMECSHFNFIQALYLKTKGDFILAGDLMRSMCVLAYKSMESTFEEIARDYQPEWLTGCEIIDDDTFLGAENSYNLLTVQKDSAATTDEDRMRLQEVGMYHLGEMVNVFRRGTLVVNQVSGDSGPPISTPILYGTVDGGLGLIGQLPDAYCRFLHELESRLTRDTGNCMCVEHSVWRSFYTEKRTELANGFIDGDLLETVLDLPRHTLARLVLGLQMPASYTESNASTTTTTTGTSAASRTKEATVDDVIKLIEDLARIH